jgi:hypothetical protein
MIDIFFLFFLHLFLFTFFLDSIVKMLSGHYCIYKSYLLSFTNEMTGVCI